MVSTKGKKKEREKEKKEKSRIAMSVVLEALSIMLCTPNLCSADIFVSYEHGRPFIRFLMKKLTNSEKCQ